MPTNCRLAGLVVTAVLAASIAGCSGSPTKGGMPWWSQGPGNVDDVQAGAESDGPAPATQPKPVTATAAEVHTTPTDNGAVPPSAANRTSTSPAAAARLSLAPQFARYGDLLFMSGQIADTPVASLANSASVADETRAVMEKIRGILESQHLTMANVVNTTIFLADINDLAAVEAAYDSYFRGARPANSVVAVTNLPGNARVQIAAVAGR